MIRPQANRRRRRVLAWLFTALATGCAHITPQVSVVTPRVVRRPEYGDCVEVGGKVTIPSVGVVTQLSSTCFAAMDAAVDSGESDAAVDSGESDAVFIPFDKDAGVTE